MNAPTRLEAQIVYFAQKSNARSGNIADNWAYVSLPITIDHTQIDTPTLPDNIVENFDETKRQFLGYLSDLCEEGGAMGGWKVHSIKGPVGNQLTDGIRVKVIQVREQKEDSSSDSK